MGLFIWFQLTGILFSQIFRLKNINEVFLGIIVTTILSVYISFFGSASRIIFFLPILFGFFLIKSLSFTSEKKQLAIALQKYPLVVCAFLKSNVETYLRFILFSAVSLVGFIHEIHGYPPGIISLGNPDPINYGIESRNLSEHGFSSTSDFANYDLGKATKFDWTGSEAFLSSIYTLGKTFKINSGYYYLVGLSFFIAVFCIGLIKISSRMYAVRGKFGDFFQIVIIVILISSQLIQYIIGNGFLAQIIFTSLLPYGIIFLWDHYYEIYKRNDLYDSVASRLTAGLVLGTLVLYYAPLGVLFYGIPIIILVFLPNRVINRLQNSDLKIQIREVFFYCFGLTLGLFPLLGYLEVPNSKLLISGAGSMPGWKLENFNLLNLLPGQILHMPAESNWHALSFRWFGSIETLLLIFVTFIGIMSKRKHIEPINLFTITSLVTYATILFLYFLTRYGLSAYPTWKFLSYVQILGMIAILPLIRRGIDTFVIHYRLNKKKLVLQNKRNLAIILGLVCVFYAAINLTQTADMMSRSGYSYSTPKWVIDLTKLDSNKYSSGLNIELKGYNGMLAAFYIPVNKRAITETSGYYVGINRIYPFTISDSLQSIETGNFQVLYGNKFVRILK